MAYGDSEKIKKIKKAIEGIQYGSVLITIHDGKITQIDCTEKMRFPNEKKESHKL